MQAVIAGGLWLAKMADPTTKVPITKASSTIFTVNFAPSAIKQVPSWPLKIDAIRVRS